MQNNLEKHTIWGHCDGKKIKNREKKNMLAINLNRGLLVQDKNIHLEFVIEIWCIS